MKVLSHELDTASREERAKTIATSLLSVVKDEKKNNNRLYNVIANNRAKLGTAATLYNSIVNMTTKLAQANNMLYKLQKDMYASKGYSSFFDVYTSGYVQ